MELIRADVDGWPRLKLHTARRDGGCIAQNPEAIGRDHVAPDQCRDVNGWLMSWTDVWKLEWDHVRHGYAGQRMDDEAHGVTVCPWHHRGSGPWRSDSKVNREAIRAYLARLYPEAWAGVL